MSQTYTVPCLSQTLAPLTHMSGVAGNEAIIAREPVGTSRGVIYLPFLSGNALRHRCVREPGMMWLIQQYELGGKLTLPQLNFLLHGGNLSESNASEDLRRIAAMQNLWPLLRLCGGSLPNQIIAGSLEVWRGILVCEENRNSLAASCPELPGERLLPAERFIGSYQYTRGDAAKTGLAKESALEPSNLMIFGGQCVNRGALFFHGYTAKHVSEIELGALLHSLRLWQAAGGTIGGQAARGHGRLDCQLLANGYDQQNCVDTYVQHALSVKDDAIAWLKDCWE